MRVIKQAYLSIIRKPSKAIMIFLILFIVNGLIFTGIIIQNSVRSSKKYVRQELGAVVEMQGDYAKAMKDGLTFEDINTKLQLTVSLAKELAKDSRVKELYISSTSNVKNEQLKSAVDLGNGEGQSGMAVSAINLGAGEGTFVLNGSNRHTPIEFTDGTLTMTQGRFRDDNDMGKDTLYISEEFAAKNNLTIGDFIDLTSAEDGKAYPFEIIGIFSGSPSYLVDELRTSQESVEKLAAVSEEALQISTVKILLNDPLEVEGFMKQQEKKIPNEYITLYSNDNQYQTLTRPLELVDTIIGLLLVIVFIAGASIMMVVIAMFIKDRRFEIGLLLSSGEGKEKIFAQFMLEIMLVAVIAFVTAVGVSKITSDFTASWIVNTQLVEDETQNMGMIAIGAEDQDRLEISDVANEFNVALNEEVIRNLLLVSLGIVIAATGAPLIIILGYKPRESLQS